jgi:(R)-benzylsuccinyl-CoA dehydrogenase
MDFTLPTELKQIQETARRFAVEELRPHEPLVLRREAERGFGDQPLLPPELEAALQAKAKDLGLWGIDVPEVFDGQALGALTKCLVIEQLKRSIVPFVLPPDSPNLRLLQELCAGEQVERYLLPYARGDKRASLALTEAGAGSDIGAMRTRAERRGGGWVLTGAKSFISHARQADFFIVVAVTDPAKGRDGGHTLFLVDRDTPGLSVPTSYPMIGEYCPYEVVLQDVSLGDGQVMGEVGKAMAPLQRRLGVRRLEIAARSLGFAHRCIEMMLEHAKARRTFGQLLADRQAVQWWIADSYQEMEMVRLLAWRLASGLDAGEGDLRREAAMVKVQGSEMIGRVVDRAIQLFGAMGVSKELPLEYMYRCVRVWRIVEGPSEVHRWTIARDLLKQGLPA